MKIGVLGLAFLIMLTLKLLGLTSISWALVTLPLWGGIALILFVSGLCLLFDVLMQTIDRIIK